MKTLPTLFVAAGLAVAALALPAAAPQPGPEHRQLAVWYGDWSYAGEIHATPFGPAGRFSGHMTGAPIQGGFASQFLYHEVGPGGPAHFLEIDFWDPITRNHAYILVGDDGYAERGSFTMQGDLTTFENTIMVGDQPRRIRGTEIVAPDRSWFTRKIEVLAEGKNWVPYTDAKFLKAPKTTVAADPRWNPVQQSVVDVFDAWAQGQPLWNQDRTKVTGLWTPDFTMWDLMKPAPMDRAGAEKMMTDFHARMKTTSFGIATESVIAKDGFALANGHYAETYVTSAGIAMKGGGPWSATLVHADGKWLVQAMSYLDRDGGPVDPAVAEQHLVKLENDWAKAYLTRDVKALGRIEAEQWVCTSNKGEVFSRAEDMADLESGTYAATEFKIENLKVRLHGNTAVVTGLQTEKATYKGEDASGVFAITDTWQKQPDGSWQCIASQLTKIEKK